MRIALVGSFWKYALESSYARAFRALGYDVLELDFDSRYREHVLARMRGSEIVARRIIARSTGNWLLEELRRTVPDVVVVFKGRYLLPEMLDRARASLPNARFVNINPDSPWEAANSTSWLLESIPLYDLHLTWSRQLVPRFEAASAKRVAYLPFAYDPELHASVEYDVAPEYDAVLVGTYDPSRETLLEALTEFNIGIWGNGWDRSKRIPQQWLKGKAVYGAESAKLLRLGKVALNPLRKQNTGAHNMRSFEIPATASFMLTDRTPEHAEWFREGVDIECFSSTEELISKLREIRKGLTTANYGKNASVRIADETYRKRAEQLIRLL